MTTTPPAHMSAHASARDCVAKPSTVPANASTAVAPMTAATTTTTAVAPLDSDATAMLEILDMDLDMSIPDVAATISTAASLPMPQQQQQQLAATPTPTTTPTMVHEPSAELSAAAMKSQTCVTFLHIMKEFSESSCNATEMVQRVDSLVHQDEHLLKLLPLTQAASEARRLHASSANGGSSAPVAPATTSSKRPRDLCNTSDADDTDDVVITEPMDVDVDSDDSRLASPRSVDLARPVLRKASADLAEPLATIVSDDHATRAAKRQRENDKEMDAHDELQRWIDLDLELDHRMDVFDFTQDQHAPVEATAPTARPATTSGISKSALHVAGFLRGPASSAARELTPLKRAPATWPKALDSKSATAALFGDDDDDDDCAASSATAVLDTVARAKLLASASAAARSVATATASGGASSTSSVTATVSATAATDRARERESKCDDENVWGLEDDEYQQDLLSSIDHSVLCDRENRFLQWDLEIEAQQQQQQLSTPPPSFGASLAPPASAGLSASASSSSSSSSSFSASPPDRTKYKWLMGSASPREKLAKSPSHVDVVDDWNSLDFGTFQNRTVSHILSSCLHKRKLHHPYKHQVKLVNFNVSGDAAIADPVELPPPLGGSLATSLAFGGSGSDDTAAALRLSGATGAFKDPLSGGASTGVSALERAKGEKKAKKREERKRLLSLKMQETFADLEGTFTEQDLDFKNVAGAGSLSKMALAKLEALPLPDLSNLPQDLKELKRKIEATEHKVEGTKHRHRKGGPCPRCQVQNQLRAAKRAYHKRAVAHKKLPQLPAPASSAGTGGAASVGVGAGASAPLLDAEAADLMFSSPPLTPTPSTSSAFDSTSPSLSPMSTASSVSPVATGAVRAATAPLVPVILPTAVVAAVAAPAKVTTQPRTATTLQPTAASKPAPPSLFVAVNASTAANTALLQHRQQQQQAAAAQLVKTASRSLVAAAGMNSSHAAAAVTAAPAPAPVTSGVRPAGGFPSSATPRRPCGNTFATAASAASAASTTAPTSAPEPASPQVHPVTVTSA